MNNNILLIILLLLLLLFDNYTYSVKTKPNRNHHEYPNRDHSGMSIGVNIGMETGNVPTIFILGAQKGGSSSLFEFMREHPQLCGARKKEPQFFSQLTEYALGKTYYEGFFTSDKCDVHKRNRSDTYFMDGTTMLHHYELVIPRIAEFYYGMEISKNLKFIVALREPVSRDISWYKHLTRYLLADGNNFTNIETMYERYINGHNGNDYSGRYVEQLDFFTKFFPRNQILVLNSEDLFRNASRVMKSIQKFLNLEDFRPWYSQPFPHDDHLTGHGEFAGMFKCVVDHVPPIDCKIVKNLHQYYYPYNQQLHDWLNKTSTDASKFEPYFRHWREDPWNASCVQDGRSIINERIYNDSKIGIYHCVKDLSLLLQLNNTNNVTHTYAIGIHTHPVPPK